MKIPESINIKMTPGKSHKPLTEGDFEFLESITNKTTEQKSPRLKLGGTLYNIPTEVKSPFKSGVKPITLEEIERAVALSKTPTATRKELEELRQSLLNPYQTVAKKPSFDEELEKLKQQAFDPFRAKRKPERSPNKQRQTRDRTAKTAALDKTKNVLQYEKSKPSWEDY